MARGGQRRKVSSVVGRTYKTSRELGSQDPSSSLIKQYGADINPKDLVGNIKPHVELVPPVGLLHASVAHLDGALKYGPYNWRTKKVRMLVYIAAAMRHLQELLDGDDWNTDTTTGIRCRHEGNVLACMNIILDARETGNLIDDRPVKGAASNLIRALKAEREAQKEKK